MQDLWSCQINAEPSGCYAPAHFTFCNIPSLLVSLQPCFRPGWFGQIAQRAMQNLTTLSIIYFDCGIDPAFYRNILDTTICPDNNTITQPIRLCSGNCVIGDSSVAAVECLTGFWRVLSNSNGQVGISYDVLNGSLQSVFELSVRGSEAIFVNGILFCII